MSLRRRAASSSRPSDSARGRAAADTRPVCEALEGRMVLSAVVNAEGILVIVGTPQADSVTIDAGSANGTVVVTGVDGVANGTEFSGVLGVRVDLKSGDDTFSLSTDLRTPGGDPATLLVLGGNGQDTLSSAMGIGQPQMRGGNSHDTLSGGPAGDLLKGGRGIDIVRGHAGEDRLEGQLGRDSLFGGPDNDSLFGGFQADEMWGNGGNDLLNGDRHRDTMFGGIGNDSMLGGQGGDIFGGSPGEADDFQAGDTHFNAVFNAERNIVLMGPTFWDRFSEGEGAQTQRNTDLELAAAAVLADSYSAVSQQALNLVNDMEAMSEGDRDALRLALLGVTNLFSPEVLANPAALTTQRMVEFRDDLIAAAPASAPVTFDTFAASLIDELVGRGWVDRVTLLPANAAGTQALLFGADSVFNLSDLP